MHRRQYLAAASGLALPLAGCTDAICALGCESDGGTDQPAAVARKFYERAAAGDREGANALLHPDATWDPMTAEEIQLQEDSGMEVENATVVERSGDRAIVAVTIRLYADAEDGGHAGTLDVQVRRHEGEWLVYGDAPEDESATSQAPQVQWDVEEETDESGAVSAVVFTHAGGDVFAAEELSVRVAGDPIGGVAAETRLQTGDEIRVRFGVSGDPVAAGGPVKLVHRPTETVFGTHTLSTDSTGAALEAVFD